MRVLFALAAAILAALAGAPRADAAETLDWRQVTAEARGQEVFWNAWGGPFLVVAVVAFAPRNVPRFE